MKLKVLFITEKLEHYRIGLFNLLIDEIEFNVAHPDEPWTDGCHFNQLKCSLKRIGPFSYFKVQNISNFDVVIYPNNIRLINLITNLFKKRTYKIGLYGIGVPASYSRVYDEFSFLNYLREYYIRKYDFSIFYEQYPYIKYKAKGISPEKLSIAYNTVLPNEFFDIENKKFKSFLFIGSLYKQKKIHDLLHAYRDLFIENENVLDLEIIGDGVEFESIETFIKDNNLQNKVVLHGSITKEELLLPIMERTVVCISPGQAGLSVQKCFSYGIGFISTRNAITGGESFSIIEQVTGDYYDGRVSDLVRILKRYQNENYARSISRNCYNFYTHFRNPLIWKEGFLQNLINNIDD